MKNQFSLDFYPGDSRHTSRELETKFKDVFSTATIDWQRGQSHVDEQLACAKNRNLPEVLRDAITQQNGDVFFLEIPTANRESVLSGYVQSIDGWLGDSITLEMENYDLGQLIETSVEISEAIDFKFLLRHKEGFYLDAYYEKCDHPKEFVDNIFQFGLNDIELKLTAEPPLGAVINACKEIELNAQSILDLLTSIGEIKQTWGFNTGSDGFNGVLFEQSAWTSIFWPNHITPNAG